MSVHVPFRQWRVSSPYGAGAGWEVFSVGATAFILHAQDDRRVEPAVPLSEGREYDIPEPSMTRRVVRQRVPGGPTRAIFYQARRVCGISLPRIVRRFSAPCLSVGVGFDLTDLMGLPSGSISLPWLPSDSPRVHLVAAASASASDLTGFGAILEIGGGFGAGVSIQVLFLGTAPIAGMRAGSSSDGLDIQRELTAHADNPDTFYGRLIEFFTSMLAPHGVALMRGMNIGIGELGISFSHGIFRASPLGSEVSTIGYDDRGHLDF